MRLAGWTIEGERPPFPKFVAIGGPHTSNWDFVFFLAVTHVLDIKARFIGKHTLFRGPLGALMRRWGGIPVRRDRPQDLVAQTVAAIDSSDEAALVIAPEGTRSAAPFWKSGFYRIALAADIPIVLAYLDYPNKRAGVGPAFHPTGDVRRDMDRIRAFYADKTGRKPELQGPVRLREEAEA